MIHRLRCRQSFSALTKNINSRFNGSKKRKNRLKGCTRPNEWRPSRSYVYNTNIYIYIYIPLYTNSPFKSNAGPQQDGKRGKKIIKYHKTRRVQRFNFVCTRRTVATSQDAIKKRGSSMISVANPPFRLTGFSFRNMFGV